MRTGRPRKPTARKRLEGTYRRDRSNPNEPEVLPGAPPMPKGLDPLARERWEILVPILLGMRVLTPADGDILEGYCRAYSRAIRAGEVVEREGFTVEGQDGIKPHPCVRISRDSWTLVNQLASKLGLSPADRARVNAMGPADASDKSERELFERPALRALQGGAGGTP